MNPAASPSESGGLVTHLLRLARLIRERVAEAKARNELVETSETYVHRKFSEFKYGENGNISSKNSIEYLTKSCWHWKHQHEFVGAVIRPTADFEACAKILAEGPRLGAQQRAQWLDHFARAIATRSLSGCSDDQLFEDVSRFMGDLNDSPIDIRIVAWVEGLWLKHESLELPSCVLRRPTPRDLEDEQELSLVVHGLTLMRPIHTPPAVAELSVQAASPVFAQDELMRLMGALRLFRLGAVREMQYSIHPDSMIRPGGLHGPSQGAFFLDRFCLSAEDAAPLQDFIVRIKPLVPPPLDSSNCPVAAADLGFKRYSDAVLRGTDTEGRITAGITSLEALFLKSRERSELSHKLSLRVASLLRLLKFNPLEVQANVHKAYDIRSTYIHGGQSDGIRGNEAQVLCRKVLEYARLSTLVFLQLKGVLDKDEFISGLDRALLEPKSVERIEQRLNQLIISK